MAKFPSRRVETHLFPISLAAAFLPCQRFSPSRDYFPGSCFQPSVPGSPSRECQGKKNVRTRERKHAPVQTSLVIHVPITPSSNPKAVWRSCRSVSRKKSQSGVVVNSLPSHRG